MKNIELGISLYPEKEDIKDIDRYIETASRYGFTRIFTSMFSVEGSKEEIISFFKSLCETAHKHHMKVTGDVNTKFFRKMGANENDLSVFNEMKMDGLRMDMAYGDKRDIDVVNNPYGIEIVFSAGGELNMFKEADVLDKISVCHNFYPQRYSGISIEDFNKINRPYVENNVKVEAFISSKKKDAHGPWPVWDGLVSVEDIRNMPIEAQTRFYILLDSVSRITIGNAFADEMELKAVKDTVDFFRNKENCHINIAGVFEMDLSADRKHVLDIVTEEGISEEERKLVFDCNNHFEFEFGFNYFVRSRMGRFDREWNIKARKCDVKEFKRGDLVIVNDNLKHYMGEVQIVLKPMENDGQRNLAGHVLDSEDLLIDYIGPRELIKFVEYKNNN